jgi:hypothetical protein
MKSGFLVSALIPLSAVGFVAAALAQSAPGKRGQRDSDTLPGVLRGYSRTDSTLPEVPFDPAQSANASPDFAASWTVKPGSNTLAEWKGLAQQAEQLTHELEAARSDRERNGIKSKLSEILARQFDFRQKRHRLEIEALEAKLAKLKDIVTKR